MVFESDAAGTLVEILAGEGDTLPIGEVIARVGDASEAKEGSSSEGSGGEGGDASGGSSAIPAPRDPRVHAADAPSDVTPSPTQQEEASDSASLPSPPSSDGERIKASPVARRIAEEKGVDLAGLQGSGPGGRIVKADVEKAVTGGGGAAPAAAAPAAAPAAAAAPPSPETAKGAVEVIELSKLQQTVSRRMAESKATAPHFYLQSEIDMTRCFEARSALEGVGRRGRRHPVVQRHGGQGLRDRAEGISSRERGIPRWQVGALRARQRRNRCGGGGGSRRADDLRCRSQGPAPDRDGGARAGGQGARPEDHTARNFQAEPSPSPISGCSASPTSTR